MQQKHIWTFWRSSRCLPSRPQRFVSSPSKLNLDFLLFFLLPPTHPLAAAPNLFQSSCSFFFFFFFFCKHKPHQPFVASGGFLLRKVLVGTRCFQQPAWKPFISCVNATRLLFQLNTESERDGKKKNKKSIWKHSWLLVCLMARLAFQLSGCVVGDGGRTCDGSIWVCFVWRFFFLTIARLSASLICCPLPGAWIPKPLAFSNLSLSLFLWRASTRLSVRLPALPPALTPFLPPSPPPPPLSPGDEWRSVARQALPRAPRSV